MKIELTTISTKHFLLVTFLSIPVIFALSLGLAILTSTKTLVLLIVPLLGLAILLGHKVSKTKTKIDLDKQDRFSINNEEFLYENVIGYFINETGLTQTALCFRLNTGKSIQMTSTSVGEQGRLFRKAQEEIIKHLKIKKPDIVELEYQDIYVRQTNILRPMIYLMFGIVVIMNFIAVYLLITDKMDLPWQIFFVNFILIGLIPYTKKRKQLMPTNAIANAGSRVR